MDNSDEDRTNENDAEGIDSAIWEETAAEILAGSPYDTELGKQTSRAAVRVTIGKLSEAEFHEEYHDAVVAEFGVDDRPTGTEDDPE